MEQVHKPVREVAGDLFRPRCATCGRPIHFVPINWLVPITSPDDTRSRGWWRHNPRRVKRA